LVRTLQHSLRYLRMNRPIKPILAKLMRTSPGYRAAANLSRGLVLLTLIVVVINPVIGLVLALCLLTALLLFSKEPDGQRQFSLCLIGLGLLLTGVVEIVVLKGDIGRMNTVFKFYLQVWVLFGVACAAALIQLIPRFTRPNRTVQKADSHFDVPEGSAWTPEVAAQAERHRNPPGRLKEPWWWWVFGILLVACLLYPITATPARLKDRFEKSTTKTLDGTAYMQVAVYSDEDRPVTLEWDRQAIEWLQQNIQGTPVILEANTPLYRWGSRVSIYTGLPTVIGWDWHQKQQRAALPTKFVDERKEDVKSIYTTTDIDRTVELLQRYHVSYIYIGRLETLYYAGDGLEKFKQENEHWSVVYQNEEVTILQVH
jgi:YYY domain-containing protein